MARSDDEMWVELTDDGEIAALMKTFGNFHDACIREIHVVTGRFVDADLNMHFDSSSTVHVILHRQYVNPSSIELRFEELLGLNVATLGPSGDAILDATCVVQDGILYWADNGLWTPQSPDRHVCTWVAARRAYWRDSSEWLGSEPCYGRKPRPPY